MDERQILTSAGSAAGLDMLLYLVRKDYGLKVANQVARRLVMPPHRQGGQAQFVQRSVPMSSSRSLADLQDHVRKSLQTSHTIASMSKHIHLSQRSLLRQFQHALGMSPHAWLILERIQLAKDLLETSHHPFKRVAELAGFNSEETLRKQFKQKYALSPVAYRRQFKGAHPISKSIVPLLPSPCSAIPLSAARRLGTIALEMES